MALERLGVKAIFDEAAEIPSPVDRAAYLEHACGGDDALRRKVDSLLVALDAAGSFLESSPALDALEGTDASPEGAPTGDDAGVIERGGPEGDPDQTTARAAGARAVDPSRAIQSRSSPRPLAEGPGSMIGRYKLLQKIGEGGMGAVFMAEQEKPVRRKVALKVIKPGMDTGQVIARFEAERQALALMDHPHIARVLDAGATDAGRPYFVMELVNGVPITEYCDQNRLTTRERLELFIPVCQAIQHAHQKGIIHRDIKPSNLLVTLQDGKPMPKVIDFGIAKAIDQRLTERTMFTEYGAVIGTLEYMSPEQAEMGALDIDTRSDIYSLGVVLYELLTGSTPLERAKLRKAAYVEVLKRIREEEPIKPSIRLSESKDALPSISIQRKLEPERLTRLVRGDLDWIAMKSLEKDRTRRYETAIGLAKDIRRHLDGDAVEACPPSASYRIGKFARKHRGALATVGAFAMLLVATAGISTGLAIWANRERVRAVKAEDEAKDQKVRAEGQKARAEEEARMAIDAVKRFDEVIRDSPELKDEPALAPLRAKLLKEPLSFFKRLRERLQGDKETTTDSLDRLAMASFELANLTNEIGDKLEAERAYEESLAIRQRLARDHPSSIKFQGDLAQTHYEIGLLRRQASRPEEALSHYEQSLAIRQRLARENPRVTLFQSKLVSIYSNIGTIKSMMGQPEEALTLFEQSLAILKRLALDNPSSTSIQTDLAHCYYDIGLGKCAAGRLSEALASHEQSRAILERLTRENPRRTLFQTELAYSYEYLGGLKSMTGLEEEAMTLYERSLAIRQRLARDNPSATSIQGDLAQSYFDVGLGKRAAGRLSESMASQEQALAIRQRLARAAPRVVKFQLDLAYSYSNIGTLKSMTGLPEEALTLFEQSLAIFQRLARDNPSSTSIQGDLAHCYYDIGLEKRAAGRLSEALASHEQSLAIRQRLARAAPRVVKFQMDLAHSYSNIGTLKSMTGLPEEALTLFERSLAIRQRLALDNPSATSIQGDLAHCYYDISLGKLAAGRLSEALASHEQSLAIRERLARENPRRTLFQTKLAYSYEDLGGLKSEMGLPEEAMAMYERSLAIRQRLASEHPESLQFAVELGTTLHKMGLIDLDRRQLHGARSEILQAIVGQRKALTARPENSQYRQLLDDYLTDLIRAALSLDCTDEAADARRERDVLRDSNPKYAVLDARLGAILGGKEAPKDVRERTRLAFRAYEKSFYAFSARLYAEVLAEDPKLAADRRAEHLYHAARAAALAGCGKGKDVPPLDDIAKARLREEAREWLRAELGMWAKALGDGPADTISKIARTLKHWKDDPDFFGIRDEKELATLTAEERASFQQFWSDVDQLLHRAAAGK